MPAGWAPDVDGAARIAAQYSRQYELRHDWQAAYFTDGSVTTEEGVHCVGAAVWVSGGGRYLIDPNGRQVDNTITRAELAAIYHTVHDLMPASGGDTIFTDSLAAIHLISRAVHRPHTLAGHLHGELLRATAADLIARAHSGLRTRIVKVKAHSGITGNEGADAAAKEAGQPSADHDYVTPASIPFGGWCQPAFMPPPGMDATAPAAQTPAMVANLRGALRSKVHPATKLGSTGKGVYASAVERMYQGVDGDRALRKESNAAFSQKNQTVHPGALRMRALHLFGRWFNRRLASRWGVRYLGRPAGNGSCPLCMQHADSSGHALLHCPHRQLQAMRIERHNAATRRILKALQRHADKAGVYTVMDACPEADAASLGAESTRLPRWILPEGLVTDHALAKMRPDVLRILELPPNPTAEEIERAVQNKGSYTVQVVEVGYCSDTRWRAKVLEKQEQHAALLQALKEAGWNVDETAYVVVLGACGTVYLSGLQALEKLGLSRKQGTALLQELSGQAIMAMHNMSLARRRLERGILRGGVG